MTIRGEIAVDGARRTVTIERHFDTSPGEVWNAITAPQRLAGWIGRVELDGADFTLRFADAAETASGTITVCKAPTRLLVSWTYGADSTTQVDVTLAEAADGCDLRLQHSGLQAVGASVYGAGWEEFLAALGDRLGSPRFFEGFDAALDDYRRREAALVPADIIRESGGSRIVLRRLLDAQPEDVWAAITEPDRIGRWLWPVVTWPDDPERKRALQLGDEFALGDLSMPGGEQRFSVIALEPGASITLTWGLDRVPVRLAIETVEGGTLLRLEQGAAPDAFAAGRVRSGPDFAAGWHSLVDGLTLMLDGLTVPHPEGLWESAYGVYTPKEGEVSRYSPSPN